MFILGLYGVDEVSESTNNTQSMATKKEDISAYDLGIIISLMKETNSTKSTETKIENIEERIKDIVSGINDSKLVDFNKAEYAKKISYLNSKISINSKYNNQIAIKRDKLKLKSLELEKQFALTVNKIINGKNSFKDKKYFVSMLTEVLETLRAVDLKEYESTYLSVKNNKDNVSSAFVEEYESLQAIVKAEILIFDYLQNNMNLYRQSNIILDELSLKFIIKQINTIPGISYISEIMTYYLKISIGEILICLLIIIVALFFDKILLRKIGLLIRKLFAKRFPNNIFITYNYTHSGFLLTKTLFIYIFAVQLCMYLIVEDIDSLLKLKAFFNTTYISLLCYISYSMLIEYVNDSSDKIFNRYPNMRKEMIDFILRIAKILIFVFIVLFLLMQLGFDIKAVIASLGIGGIAVALAAKDTLSNFFGSLNIITDNSFSQGDWIKAGDVEGTVVDIRMRTTRIRTFANAMITIPNAELANMAIINWSKRRVGRRINMTLNITYTSKMSDIKNLATDIREMLLNHEGIASNAFETKNLTKRSNLLKQEDLMGIKKTLLVFVDEYNSSSIDIMIYCFTKSPDWEEWLKVKEDVIIKISALVEKNNCEFAFQSQTIYLESSDKNELELKTKEE